MNECGTIPNNYTYGGYCAERLPCGVCRLTSSMCPLAGNSWSITCGTPQTGSTTQVTSDPYRTTTAWNSEAEHET